MDINVTIGMIGIFAMILSSIAFAKIFSADCSKDRLVASLFGSSSGIIAIFICLYFDQNPLFYIYYAGLWFAGLCNTVRKL